MNIAEYFESVKDRLLTDSVVVDFKFLVESKRQIIFSARGAKSSSLLEELK